MIAVCAGDNIRLSMVIGGYVVRYTSNNSPIYMPVKIHRDNNSFPTADDRLIRHCQKVNAPRDANKTRGRNELIQLGYGGASRKDAGNTQTTRAEFNCGQKSINLSPISSSVNTDRAETNPSIRTERPSKSPPELCQPDRSATQQANVS